MASTFSGVIESFIKPEALKEFDTLGSKIDASLKGFDAVIAKAAMLSTEIQKGGAAYSQYIAASTKIADVNKQLQTTQGSVNTNLSAYNKLLTETANTIKDNTGATDDQARRIIALRTELSKTKDAVEVYQKLIREVSKENPASLSDKTFNQVFDAFGSETANGIKAAFDSLDSATKPDFIQQLTTDAAQFLEIQKQLEQELKDTAIAFRLQTKEIVAGEGSIDQLGARLENLQKAYRALTEEERNSEAGQGLKAQIEVLDPQVKELEKNIGITRRLVGDYANQIKQGLSPAFEVLQDRLSEVNNTLREQVRLTRSAGAVQGSGPTNPAEGTQRTVAAVRELVKEQGLLNVVFQKGAVASADLTTQNKQLEKTLISLDAANLKGSETYEIVKEELIKGKKAVNDLRGEVRALTR
jgi:chromosome segregation ATPase